MRTYNGYSDEMRYRHIKAYLASDQTIYGYCKKNGLPTESFKNWLRTFGVEEKHPVEDMSKAKSPTEEELRDEIKRLHKELQSLKVQLKHSEMARDAYNCMIDLAEQEFNIPIRKKSDAE